MKKDFKKVKRICFKKNQSLFHKTIIIESILLKD